MVKKVVLVNCDIEDTIKQYFYGKDVEFVSNIENCDLIVYDDYNGNLEDNAINIHPSLLPSFEGEKALEAAFMSGVKVSGITIHSKNKIIAQYPVLIGINTHIDEFKSDIKDVKKRLTPPVIESIIEDKVFDFLDLLKNPCSHSYGNCSSCRRCNK